MYYSHLSPVLQNAFIKKPYQGAKPEEAEFLFINLDANYSENIEHLPVFPQILEYHEDGIKFWKNNNIHHPFLLPSYTGSGKKFHKNFCKIGFNSNHAPLVSFIELLHVPTYERSKLVPEDLDLAHLKRLNTIIMEGSASSIFIPVEVSRLMRKSGVFPWMPPMAMTINDELDIWWKNVRKTIYKCLHFSVYGKFEIQLNEQLHAIGKLCCK